MLKAEKLALRKVGYWAAQTEPKLAGLMAARMAALKEHTKAVQMDLPKAAQSAELSAWTTVEKMVDHLVAQMVRQTAAPRAVPKVC